MKEKTKGLISSDNENDNTNNTKSEWKTQYSYNFFSEFPFVIFILVFAVYLFFI